MTCREMLKIEHPEKINDDCMGGCSECPYVYGYMSKEQGLCQCTEDVPGSTVCTLCWDQDISEPIKQKSATPSMTDLQWMMRKALGYPGIAVSITFMEDAITFNAYPYPTQDEPEGEDK